MIAPRVKTTKERCERHKNRHSQNFRPSRGRDAVRRLAEAGARGFAFPGRRRGEVESLGREEELKEIDRVVDQETLVPVDVARVDARRLIAVREEVGEERDGVAEVDRSVAVTVPATEVPGILAGAPQGGTAKSWMPPDSQNAERLAHINDGLGETVWAPVEGTDPPYSFGTQWTKPQKIDRVDVTYSDLGTAVVSGYELQVLDGADWRAVTDDLFDYGMHVTHRLDAVKTTAVRLMVQGPSQDPSMP